MMDKMSLRKKAMDMLMKDGGSIAMKIEKKKMSESMGEEESNEAEKQGMLQMMVSPEEKQMIMEMRQEKKGEKDPMEMSEEVEKEEY